MFPRSAWQSQSPSFGSQNVHRLTAMPGMKADGSWKSTSLANDMIFDSVKRQLGLNTRNKRRFDMRKEQEIHPHVVLAVHPRNRMNLTGARRKHALFGILLGVLKCAKDV